MRNSPGICPFIWHVAAKSRFSNEKYYVARYVLIKLNLILKVKIYKLKVEPDVKN